MAETLLLIEDEKLLGEELVRHLQREGWEVKLADNLGTARRFLFDDDLSPLVVLSDMNLPDGNALDLLEEAHEKIRGVEWLFLTGFGTVADSVRALRLGAYDFLEKPCAMERLDLVIAAAARSARAQRRIREATHNEHEAHRIDAFVGSSEAATAARELLDRLSRVPFSALIIGGETGTGKGSRHPHPPPLRHPLRRTADRTQLRGSPPRTSRIRTLRARSRRVHGSPETTAGPGRASAQGNSFPGRDLGDGSRPPGEIAQDDRRPTAAAPGQREGNPGRRTDRRCEQSKPTGSRIRRPVSGKISSTGSRYST